MKITITPTAQLISQTVIDHEAIPRMVRVWDGVTEAGVACKLLVAGVMVATQADNSQFEQELQEIPRNTEVILSLRNIL